MRVNLTIRRNRLEPINILWTIAPAQHQTAAHTISRFLSDVNEKFPLESDDWGLEDYTVSVGGFECLHYANATDVLRDGDHVTIQPLESVDIRSRTLSGRSQISSAGITLIDGVPFGKAALRTVDRPRIYIPPRKRRRVGDEEEARRLITAREGTSVSLSDVDRDDEQLLLLNGGEASLLEEEEVLMVPRVRERTMKHVSFGSEAPFALGVSSEDEGEDDEDEDEDFNPDDVTNDSSSTVSEPSVLPDSAASAGSPSAAISASQSAQPQGKTFTKTISISSASDSDLSSDSHDASSSVSSSDVSSDESSDSEMEDARVSKLNTPAKAGTNTVSAGQTPFKRPSSVSKPQEKNAPERFGVTAPQSTVAPGFGSKHTRNRNQRRKDSKLLKKLKANGELPETAVLADIRTQHAGDTSTVLPTNENELSKNRMDEIQSSMPSKAAGPAEASKPDLKHPALDPLPTNSIVDVLSLTEPTGKSDEFMKRRQKLLDELASGAVFVDSGASQQSAKNPKHTIEVDAEETIVGPSPKRTRLDLNASKRMIFGNLGQRVPKTRAEAELTRQKLANKSSRLELSKKHKQTNDLTSAPEAVAPEADDWRSILSVRAVECVQEGVTLSEPPYPFVQRWDPQQKLPKNRGQSKKRKQAEVIEYDEAEFDPFEDGDGTIEYGMYDGVDETGYGNFEENGADQVDLDYGEPNEESYLPSATQVFQEQADEQLMSDVQSSAAARPSNDDDELDPEDGDEFSTYPIAKQTDLVPDTIVAFKQLECTAATQWSPQVSDFRVAQVLKEDDLDAGAVAVRIHEDYIYRPRVRYDENGKRMYFKFDMPRQEMGLDDEEDDGFRILNFEELLDCRILESPADSRQNGEQEAAAEETTSKISSSLEPHGKDQPNGKRSSSSAVRPSDSTTEWNGIEDAVTDEALLASETGDCD